MSKIKNVYTCQISVGPFDNDCDRLYFVTVKTNKRSGDQVNSGRILLNALDHYNIEKKCEVAYFYFSIIMSHWRNEEKIPWDQQNFAGSGIKILITFGIRDQKFG